MLWAVYLLFAAIVGVILYLVFGSLSPSKAPTYNASTLIEGVDHNRMTTHQGDVVFCYRLTLPEAFSLSEEAYSKVNELWRIALKDLPTGTIVMRSDRYDRGLYDASSMPENSYIQREEKKHAATLTANTGTSYLFVVFTGFRATHEGRSQNPFIARSHREFRAEDDQYSRFATAVEGMYWLLQGSGMLTIDPIPGSEIEEYTHYFFNGYQSDFLTDVYATNRYVKAGDHFVGAVSIEHERQFPEVLRIPQPGATVKIPVGLLEDVGMVLPMPHICNQIITISGHEKEYELIKTTIETFQKNKGFSTEHAEQTERLDTARKKINDNLEAMLVRGHTNIIFWADSERQVSEYRTRLTNFLKQNRGFEPVVPTGVELRNVVYCSHPATVSSMDKESYYLVDLKQAVAMFQNAGGYISDAEGVLLSDPVNHVPVRYDMYDASKKYVDSRNVAVVGRTGGGKSVLLEKIVEGYHNDPKNQCVNIIIDCGGSYDKAARLYDPQEVFIFKYVAEERLGLDPFAFGTDSDSDRIDDICELIWLVIKPDNAPSTEEGVSMRKVVAMYLEKIPLAEQSWRGFYQWVCYNPQQILEACQIRAEYFDVNQFVHNGSEWCDGGLHGNVFAHSEDPLTRLQGKRLLIFELENIKTKPQLLGIVVHAIGIAIRTLIWKRPGVRGNIIYEEFAELMKIDIIFSVVLYQMQAIRKKGGSAWIVLQNLDQLALNAGDRYRSEGGAAGALMKNIETTVFLAGSDPTGFEKYAPGFTEHDRRCVLALKNNYTSAHPYSSFYIYRTKKSMLLTLSISPRTYLAFQTEGEICMDLGELYARTGSMEAAIEQYETTHQTN